MDGILQGPLQHSSRSRSDDGALGVLDPWQQDSQLPTFLTPHQVAADTLFQLLCCIAGMSPKWSKDSTVSSKYGFQATSWLERATAIRFPMMSRTALATRFLTVASRHIERWNAQAIAAASDRSPLRGMLVPPYLCSLLALQGSYSLFFASCLMELFALLRGTFAAAVSTRKPRSVFFRSCRSKCSPFLGLYCVSSCVCHYFLCCKVNFFQHLFMAELGQGRKAS